MAGNKHGCTDKLCRVSSLADTHYVLVADGENCNVRIIKLADKLHIQESTGIAGEVYGLASVGLDNEAAAAGSGNESAVLLELIAPDIRGVKSLNSVDSAVELTDASAKVDRASAIIKGNAVVRSVNADIGKGYENSVGALADLDSVSDMVIVTVSYTNDVCIHAVVKCDLARGISNDPRIDVDLGAVFGDKLPGAVSYPFNSLHNFLHFAAIATLSFNYDLFYFDAGLGSLSP